MIQKSQECCIICTREIRRSNNHHSKLTNRSRHAVTCNRKCARIYKEVRERVTNLLNREARAGKKEKIVGGRNDK